MAATIATMGWIALLLWLLLAPMALFAGLGVLTTPGAAGQVLAGAGGFALCVIFLAVGGSSLVGWMLLGAAVVGVLACALAVSWLVRDDHDAGFAGQGADETQALLAGVELPLFLAAVPVTLAMAITGSLT